MRISVRDFFDEYLLLYEELKSLKKDYSDMFADRRSFGWLTRQITPAGISVGKAASRYMRTMIALKRELCLPWPATTRLNEESRTVFKEDSKVAIPWDVRRGLEQVIRFVRNESQRRTDIEFEPEPV